MWGREMILLLRDTGGAQGDVIRSLLSVLSKVGDIFASFQVDEGSRIAIQANASFPLQTVVTRSADWSLQLDVMATGIQSVSLSW